MIATGVLLYCGTPVVAYADQNNNLSQVIKQTVEKVTMVQEEQRKDDWYNARLTQVRNYTESFLGTPYVWGGSTPRGFDCSGLVQYVYAGCNIDLPRTTYGQIDCGIPVSLGELMCGDIVFWGNYHVGIYIGDGMYIHAPQSGDVVKYSSMSNYCPTSARRLIFRE